VLQRCEIVEVELLRRRGSGDRITDDLNRTGVNQIVVSVVARIAPGGWRRRLDLRHRLIDRRLLGGHLVGYLVGYLIGKVVEVEAVWPAGLSRATGGSVAHDRLSFSVSVLDVDPEATG
jgi:hypothetical protein